MIIVHLRVDDVGEACDPTAVGSCTNGEICAADCSACELGVAAAKRVVKCQPAIATNTRSLVVKRLQVLSKCGTALLNCAQKKPGDPCAAKVKAKCSKDLAKLSGTTEKFVAAVQKGCANVPQTTMLSAQGLDFAQIAA